MIFYLSSFLIFEHSIAHLPEFPIIRKFQSNDDVINLVTHALKYYQCIERGCIYKNIELHVTRADKNKTKRKI